MESDSEQFQENAHRAYVTNSVLSACHMVEANINELYTEAAEENTRRLSALGQGAIELMAGVWKRGCSKQGQFNHTREVRAGFRLLNSFQF